MMTASPVAMVPRQRIFVCVQNRPVGDPRSSCQSRAGGVVYRTFLEELDKFAAGISCKLTSTGCLGPCAAGAAVLVYPGGILYGRVTPNDVHEIVSQHIVGGKPVTRLIVDDAAV